ncbi:MAG: RnfABCDGE type electron transport complex subunit D [Clostridia bacterium]|nr:RnfABCDGE type electron transport complex subunit D [Clostridia bacterium]
MAKKSPITTQRSLSLDLLAMLILPVVSSWYFYGTGALRLVFISVIVCVVCEMLGRKVLKPSSTVTDLSAVTTGIILALMLPANAPLWIPVIGGMFAIIAAKLPFGSVKKLPFSPAAASFAFLTICFPDIIFNYPKISAFSAALSSASSSSLTSLLARNASISISSVKTIDIIIGNFPGPMGAGCIMILAGSAIYMLIRRTKLFITVAGFITGAALAAICFPRTGSILTSLVLELCAGYMIFAALFLVTEPGTQPEKWLSRLLYGFTTGLGCMLMRRFGAFEECSCFAVLIVSAAWPVADKAINKLNIKKGAKKVK